MLGCFFLCCIVAAFLPRLCAWLCFVVAVVAFFASLVCSAFAFLRPSSGQLLLCVAVFTLPVCSVFVFVVAGFAFLPRLCSQMLPVCCLCYFVASLVDSVFIPGCQRSQSSCIKLTNCAWFVFMICPA